MWEKVVQGGAREVRHWAEEVWRMWDEEKGCIGRRYEWKEEA